MVDKILHCEFDTEIVAIFEGKKMTIFDSKNQKNLVETEFLEDSDSMMLISDTQNDEYSLYLLNKNSNCLKRIIFDSEEGKISEIKFL